MPRGGRRPGAGRPPKKRKRTRTAAFCLHDVMMLASHIPTSDPKRHLKRCIVALVAIGATHGEVASVLEIEENALRHEFRSELDLGVELLRVSLHTTLLVRALGRGGHRSSVTALLFWMRNRHRLEAETAGHCRLGLACGHTTSVANLMEGK